RKRHGTLTITFDSAETPATSTLVNLLLRSIAYTNISNTPPAQVVLAWSFSDGGPAAPGGGTTTVNITRAAEPTLLTGDSASTAEDTPVVIDVLRNDHDPDTALAVTAIDGTPI